MRRCWRAWTQHRLCLAVSVENTAPAVGIATLASAAARAGVGVGVGVGSDFGIGVVGDGVVA